MTHIRKHERPTTTAAGGGLLLRPLLLLLLLLSAATDVVRATEFLCANSREELELSCGTAKNCFSDSCPPEAPFCFPFQCKMTGDASTAATMSTTTAATTTAAKFLCAKSLAELELSCGTAKNCFSDPCPSETPFCFPFQCNKTSDASTAATMTTTTAATTTAATTTADATTTDTTTTETSTTVATTTTDTTTETTTTDATTTDATTTLSNPPTNSPTIASTGSPVVTPPSPTPPTPPTDGTAGFWYPDYATNWFDAGCLNTWPLIGFNENDRPMYDTQLECCNQAYGGQTGNACIAQIDP